MISLYADGQKRLFATDSRTVGDVLASSKIKLHAGDLVEPAASTVIPFGQFNINIYRARPVLIVDGNQTYHITSAYQSPRLLAKASGLTMYPEDRYQTNIITNIVQNGAIGEQITIQRAKPFIVKADGKVRVLRTQAGTIGDALKAANIPLGAKDTVSPSLTAPVLAGDAIQITRVSEATVTETKTIPHPVQTISDPNLLKGNTTVRTAGADGQKTVTYLVHYTNGVETAREQLQVVSQTAPQTEVDVVGTKVLFEGSVEYWRPMVIAAATRYGIDPNMMLRIMQCESNGNAADVSHFIVNGQHPTGLFQYLPSTWTAAGGTMDNIMDGATQIQITAKKMATSGTGAWACR
jgi:uncharacterized protein YabE (DUF348 family)